MEQGEQIFLKGFNSGYLLAKHEPDLLSKVAKTLEPKNDYLDGFLSGKEEYELELQNAQLNELGNLRDKSRDNERDLQQ